MLISRYCETLTLVREAFGDDKLRFNSDLLWHEPDAELRDQSKPTNFLGRDCPVSSSVAGGPEEESDTGLTLGELLADHSMNCLQNISSAEAYGAAEVGSTWSRW